MRFWKYEALGNDYLVMDPAECGARPEHALIQRVCDRRRGVGSDGILVPQDAPGGDSFALRIFNPDGSEAEKSGNGLRMYARFLLDTGKVATDPFTIQTPGGLVRCRLDPDAELITMQIGRASFRSGDIGTTGPDREVLQETIAVGSEEVILSGVSLGNPHCVVVQEEVSEESARRLGPGLENAPLFPNRTNVEFAQVLDEHRIRIHIWERGAGYTHASGTGSSASACVCCRLGLVKSPVTVELRHGEMLVAISPDFDVTLTGPVTRVADGTISPEVFERK